MRITKASGEPFELPIFYPIVGRHLQSPSSYVATLLNEINVKEIYAPLFKGKSDLVFLDIGANIGFVSLYAYDSCSHIVAVEPAPATFDVLRVITLALPKIEPVCAALAPLDGPCEFFLNDQNSTASSTVNTFGELIEVPGLTLTSILNLYQLEHVDVCKIDAEGAEGESLTFKELHAAKDIIDTYYIETHNCPKTTWQQKLSTLCAVLHSFGYTFQQISGMTLIASK